MNTKKILLATIIIWIVGVIIMFATCASTFKWVYEIPPNIWLSEKEITSSTNMIASNLIGLLRAFLFVIVFAIFYKGIPWEGAKKGIQYGFYIWLVSGLSGMISLPFFMTIAPTVVIYWIIQSLVSNVIFGAIIGAIYKEKNKIS